MKNQQFSYLHGDDVSFTDKQQQGLDRESETTQVGLKQFNTCLYAYILLLFNGYFMYICISAEKSEANRFSILFVLAL